MRGIVGLIFIAIGIWTTIDPKSAVAFKMKFLNLLGAKVKITVDSKGYKVLRFVGIATALFGLFLL